MITYSLKFKWPDKVCLLALSLSTVLLLSSCTSPGRTPKLLDYATSRASEMRIKLFDGSGLPLDLAAPDVRYNGYVTVEVNGKKYPPVLCDPEESAHFNQEIRDDGFFLRIRYSQSVSRDFTSVALDESKCFISGGNYGLDGNGERVEAPTYRTYVYNRLNEEILPGPPMMPPRRGHVMVLLNDKRVLIAGGTAAGGKPITEVQIYDPVTKEIKNCGHMSRPRTDFLLLPLANGTVLIAGGRGVDDEEAPDKLLSSIELVDLSKNTVSLVGQMHEARLKPQGFAFGPDSAIIYGGKMLAPHEGESPVLATSVEVYKAR